MTWFVLDASVAAKWMLPATGEPLTLEAFRLLAAYESGDVNLIVPDIFWAECGTIMWKAVRHQRLERTAAELAIESLRQRSFPTVSSRDLLLTALAIAFDYDRAAYDCLYVALAAQSRRQFITADERLANAMAARLPVKWLGAF